VSFFASELVKHESPGKIRVSITPLQRVTEAREVEMWKWEG
jgi:hypothetical protein